MRLFRCLFFLLFPLFLVLIPLVQGHARSLPPVSRTVLPNGLVLLVSEEHSLPFVIMEMIVDAGSRSDPAGAEGLARLTAKSLLLGTSALTNSEINRRLDFLGASLGSSTGSDYSVLRLQVLKKDLDQGLDLFMQALSSPSFPVEEVEKLKQRTLGEIQASDEQPLALAEKRFQRLLFPESPYGHPVEGTAESVKTITREAIVAFYRAFYHPNNAIVAIVGDVTVRDMERRILPLLAGLPKRDIPAPSFTATYGQGPREERIERDIVQANIIVGNAGLKRSDPDYYAAAVMNYILGGGSLQSRLMEEIRVKRGWAYSVMSLLEPDKYQGSFQIVLQTKSASADQAIELAKIEMDRMRTRVVSAEELNRAKRYLVGNFPLRLDTQSELAGILTRVEYYGLGPDYLRKYPSLIQSVTREDVLRVARRCLLPDQAIVVIVGNVAGQSGAVKKDK